MTKQIMVAATLALCGCASSGPSQTVIRHAATEWDCPQHELQVEQLDSETYRVEGCQRHADYSCAVNGRTGACERVSGT
jgi:hypothetical protein